MDFFRRQADARRFSRRLVILFAVAVTAVVAAVNLVVLTLLANAGSPGYGLMWPDAAWVAAHPAPAFWTTLVVAGFIGGASLYRAAQLREGGGAVAISLGGQRVLPDTGDPRRLRLLNVVEEMAIAAGLPVPEVYLLEHEGGINAFAAGLNPADAAIGVTQGALEHLDRAELQGVIGHEFSHILNGDMALNTRLLALLYGLMAVGLAARLVLYHAPRASGRGRGAGAGALLAGAALVVLAIGSVGLFFGRLIQAAVSRHRERLADASAVQFTRDTRGLRDALVKIGASLAGSRVVHPEAAEVAHMLFAPARYRPLALGFATHPPLVDRIRALDAGFDPAEFGRVRRTLDQARRPPGSPAAPPDRAAAARQLAELTSPGVLLAPGELAGRVGNPLAVHVDFARVLAAALPDALGAASLVPESAAHLLLALCLDRDEATRNLQLSFLARQLGAPFAEGVQALLAETDRLHPAQRLPLLLRLIPALRRLERAGRQRLLASLHALLQREGGQLSLHAYALRKLAHTELRDELDPGPSAGYQSLGGVRQELGLLFAVLARAGQDDPAGGAGYRAGLRHVLAGSLPEPAIPENWPARLDQALNRLDRLRPGDKARVVHGLGLTVAADRRLQMEEVELLRAVCGVLHCPLPPLEAVAGP